MWHILFVFIGGLVLWRSPFCTWWDPFSQKRAHTLPINIHKIRAISCASSEYTILSDMDDFRIDLWPCAFRRRRVFPRFFYIFGCVEFAIFRVDWNVYVFFIVMLKNLGYDWNLCVRLLIIYFRFLYRNTIYFPKEISF